jgi:hypothetical protein
MRKRDKTRRGEREEIIKEKNRRETKGGELFMLTRVV